MWVIQSKMAMAQPGHISYFSATVIKNHNKNQLPEARVYFSLQFQRDQMHGIQWERWRWDQESNRSHLYPYAETRKRELKVG